MVVCAALIQSSLRDTRAIRPELPVIALGKFSIF